MDNEQILVDKRRAKVLSETIDRDLEKCEEKDEIYYHLLGEKHALEIMGLYIKGE